MHGAKRAKNEPFDGRFTSESAASIQPSGMILNMEATIKYKFDSPLEESHNKLWGAHVQVPRSVADKLTAGGSRRVIATLNGMVEYQCAMIPHGNGTFVITVNKKLRGLLGVTFGDEMHVRLERDETKYGLPMPVEMNELLHQDRTGNRLFHALTAGRQRTLLYIVGQARNANNRATRGAIIIRHLKANGGKINYRELNKLMQKR